MRKGRLTLLFQKYTDRTCTQAEYAELMLLIGDGQQDQELDLLMTEAWAHHVNGPELDKNSADRLFDKVLQAVDQEKNTVQIRASYPWKSWPVWAAASVLLALLAFWFYRPSNQSLRGTEQARETSAPAKSMVNLVAVDEHRKIKLPDGSVVILNNASTIEFPSDFSGHTREVMLKGEGYFDIKHDAQKPFIVHTGKISTTVLGTAFNIKAYDKENDVVVTVTRGKVLVKNEDKTLGILVPDQQIVFNKNGMKSSLNPVTASKMVEWQEKDLYFDDVTMDNAAAQLARRFNVKIKFLNEESRNCRFTATFLKGESLDEILQVIASFNHINYQKNAGEIVLSGKGCK